MSVETWEPTQWRLLILLRDVACGLITQRDDVVWFEGAPANTTVALGVSVLDQRGLLLTYDEPDGHLGYALSIPGDALLRRWDTDVFGPGEPVASSRPLTCLDDNDCRWPWPPSEWERLLLDAIHRHQPTDLDGPDDH